MKPKSAGGLAYINVTNADGMTAPILEQGELETTLFHPFDTELSMSVYQQSLASVGFCS